VCSHYESPTPSRLKQSCGVEIGTPIQTDLWPGYLGPFIRRQQSEEPSADAPQLEALSGIFGLLPFWAKDKKLSRHTYNARSETVAEKPSFRDAWRRAKHCIIPATAIYEPDWRTGKAIPTRISQVDGEVMAIAGLWESWADLTGHIVHSYTMLTLNADDHPLMRNFHRPDDEKRMVVILSKELHLDWLSATPVNSHRFFRQFPADQLQAG
jgi:putative SOS response-associated peptidase YedK